MINRVPTRLAFAGRPEVLPVRLRIGDVPIGGLALVGAELTVETDLTLDTALGVRAELDKLIADLEKASRAGIAREPKPPHTAASLAAPQ
ncbi:hypothetical protein OG884_15700 [Streptosporangium sp. NBC_01755]|uniref:hypothetical protein n=1 Tax=Streptosporangium sp. NBC_01755 TaxID=2975949 RepID=UPI002DDA7DB2|nr:hypothetical protein [Streptosporangium sp. NBC_01755]WSD03278.1 hypothetical protein OG884_15700 [Streptosporangium sp. NBC_01755]